MTRRYLMLPALCVSTNCLLFGSSWPEEPLGVSLLSQRNLPIAASSESIANAVARVYPALVNLEVVTRTYGEGRSLRRRGVGSGVIVDRAGHVLTNFHVARDALRIQATLSNGVSLEAEVLAHDPLTDLSVLRLRPRPGTREIPELSPAPLGEDAVVSVGEPVLAMGNPFALSSSVTIGIVSNPRRVFRDRSGTDIEELESSNGDSSGLLTQWIQHDALILPGNSGGPLVNLKGEVIGINQLGGTGLGFAIPLSVARKVLNRVLSGKGLERGDLGVRVAPVGRLGQTEGALVSWVRPGSSAEQSGLQPGDRLLELAGEALQVQFVEQVPEFYQRVAELPVGVPVEVVFERGGKRLKRRILVERLDVQVGLEGEVLELGLSVRKVTPAFALVRNLPLERGWWVSGVRPGYPGATARPAIQAGDVLLAIDGKAVAELRGYGVPPPAEGGRWLIELQRGGERILSVARPQATRSGRVGGELPKPWLGVRTQVLTEELARALGLPQAGGFRVTEVLPWTEAERAGLQVGDLLIAIDQNPLEARRQQDSAELQRLVEERSIGEIVTLGVRRGSERLNIPVRLETRPVASEEVDTTRQEDFEFTARDLTFLDRAQLLRDREIQGVFVSEVSSGGWADLAGLAVGDVILAVDGQQTPSVRKLEEALQRVLRERKEVVPFFVRRGKRTQFLFVEAAWQDRGSKEDL